MLALLVILIVPGVRGTVAHGLPPLDPLVESALLLPEVQPQQLLVEMGDLLGTVQQFVDFAFGFGARMRDLLLR